MKVHLLFLSVLLVVLAAACEAEEEPKISAEIQPTFGRAGTVVTIKGENFETTPSSITVTFPNGKLAEIVSATPTEIKVKAPSGSSKGVVRVSMRNQTVEAGEFTFYTLYTYGNVFGSSPNFKATYWKDDEAIEIPQAGWSYITEMVVVGNDVHAIGYGLNPAVKYNTHLYWKNGVVQPVEGNYPDYKSKTIFTGIAVSTSGKVYISGYEEKALGLGLPKYWDNGKRIDLSDIQLSAASDIAVMGNDVYVVGREDNDPGPIVTMQAVYWKNGVKTTLIGGKGYHWAYAITFEGTDMYIVGEEYGTHASNVVYWKNDVFTRIADNIGSNLFNVDDHATSISVSGNDVYIGGYHSDWSTGTSPIITWAFWKNGQMVKLREQPAIKGSVLDVSVHYGYAVTTVGIGLSLVEFSLTYPSYIFQNTEEVPVKDNSSKMIVGHQVVEY